MKAEIFWVDQSVAVLARPRGGDWLADEVISWREQGINVVVSLLTEEEENELNLNQERALCEVNELHYYSFPINDRSVPDSMENTFDLIVQLSTLMIRDSKKVGIHCRQGSGRSPLIVAAVLV